jgi:hypothetical protein
VTSYTTPIQLSHVGIYRFRPYISKTIHVILTADGHTRALLTSFSLKSYTVNSQIFAGYLFRMDDLASMLQHANIDPNELAP